MRSIYNGLEALGGVYAPGVFESGDCAQSASAKFAHNFFERQGAREVHH